MDAKGIFLLLPFHFSPNTRYDKKQRFLGKKATGTRELAFIDQDPPKFTTIHTGRSKLAAIGLSSAKIIDHLPKMVAIHQN
jgi:hypothetical protein